MTEPGITQNAFNIERLHDYGRRLAHSQSSSAMRGSGHPLRAMLEESREVLLKSYHSLAKASLRQEEITPGAQWLLDNFYLIKDQMREVRRQLPRKYYFELPKLSSGVLKGLPRVYEIMHELASLVDNTINQQNVRAYAEGYQEVELLRLGELWAIPSMLRIVLMQNLHTTALQLRNTQRERQRAHDWAQRILKAASNDPVDGLLLARELTDRDDKFTDVFVISLAKHLQGHGPTTAPVLDWLERRLQARHVTLAEIVQIETQRQTQRQVSIANAITTLRWATETDWKSFVESLSGVERTLRQDPAGIYPKMDFKTRDIYRHRVEEMAKYSSLTEFDIAQHALSMAQAAEACTDDEDPSTHCQAPRHVGTYLIGEAAPELETEAGYHPPLAQRLRRFSYRHPTFVYLASILSLTVLAQWATLAYANSQGATPLILVLIAACAFLPFLDFAVAITNRFVALSMPPRRLPKLDYEKGIPAESRSMVVIPTLISSPENAREQIEHLEIHALANPNPGLRFALLTDFPDASEQTMPGDEATLKAARKAIADLNERYRDTWGDVFFLLHRERRWDEAQGVWMGWERKRGKLEEFNILLREPQANTSYTTIEGDFFEVTADDAIRYVITLDADTRLPPGSAVDLVRTAAHPLNEPYYDPQRKRITKGYGILQPRVSISLEGSTQSAFARIYSGNVGLDLYTTAVSDVYQDLFCEGIFTGKGLYDVDAFRKTLEGAIPENIVLSHDLLEGNYARAALVSDIEVFDDYPSSYIPFARRLHRWVRGDWQILSWLFPVVRDTQGRWRRNPISTAGKWKILDNLRRSLTGPALLLLLLLGWIVLPSSPFLWTGIVLAVLAFPIYINLTTAFLTRPHDVTFSSYFQSTLSDLKIISLQTGLTTALLAHQSVVTLDAIFRTLWRMVVSKKHLLDWVTAHQAEASSDGSLRSYVRYMWTSIAWGGLIFMLNSILDPRAWFVALPFAVLWVVAPWIAYRVSKPAEPKVYFFTSKDTTTLRTLARRTWRYFDRFVTSENRWLPPDNFQEEPYRGLARRTSPTNIGLALLSMQAAYDLGYLARTDLIHRLAESLGSIRLLDRHEGHFYNWYSTDTGEVMYPHYISTVDSGNMAAALIALRQSLHETETAPWPNPAFFDGLRDTLASFKEDLASLPSEKQTALASTLETLEHAWPQESPTTLAAWKATLDVLISSAQMLAASEDAENEDIAYWRAEIVSALEKQQDELTTFAPWLEADQTLPEPLQTPLSLRDLSNTIRQLRKDDAQAALRTKLEEADAAITTLFDRAAQLIAWCDDLVEQMDFSLLYDDGRGLFTIGYNVDTLNADNGMYDLLASEARLASYVAIGKGDVPVEHWFRLSRPLASFQDRKALLSWSGTMFEYLMPLLLMRSYPNTLLDETSTNVVRRQIQYGRRKNLPWGISESAYNALNLELDYQYRAFGVPGLGLKRGLSEDYVVAPYATVLALLVDPEAALDNMETLRKAEAYGPMGFYDAVDYTKTRLFTGQDHAVVRTYMAHHQGMILLAAQNVLTNNLMRRRFHAAPNVRASELLLQERTARKIETIDPHPMETEVDPGEQPPTPNPVTYHGSNRLNDPTPYGHLISNGSYTTFISNAGAGYSSFNKWAVTRWTPDRTTDDDGFFIYVRDLEKHTFWSVGHQPVQRKPDRYDVWFHLNKAEFARVDDWIETFMEVCVSPEDNMEIRRLTLTNYSDEPRRLELTSYAEVVINEQAADQAHPAFSKLFVQTEYVPEHHALLATRRQRSEHDQPIWLVHTIADDDLDRETGPLQIETDRAQFIGRGRTLAHPAAMDPETKLSGATGNVLDPVVSLRRVIELKPKERIRLTFSLGTANSRKDALRLADQYDNPPAVQRAVELATVYGNVETRYLGITGEQAMQFQQLASAVLYGAPSLRASEDILLRNRKQQPGLWAYGISGDLPLIVVHVEQMDDMELARTMIKAHEYWKLKNLKIDVVFLNEHPPSYVQELQDALVQAVQTSHERGTGGQQGGIFVLRADQVAEEDLMLIHTMATAVLEGSLPSLLYDPEETPSEDLLYRSRPDASAEAVPSPEDLPFYNGYGGFSEDGSAYIIRTSTSDTEHTPLPWINVLANEQMGCLATESGAGYTWSMNSRENRLTPWSNDPVTDPVGEALYIRDEDDGFYWSPTPHPAGDDAPYETEHGFGYTTYHHRSQQIDQETTVFVTRHDPVKIVRLRLTNRSDHERRLSVFRYQEWVLGVLRAASARYVATSRDADTGAIFAQNWYNHEFAGRVAFARAMGASADDIGFTTDRTAFLGRNGSVRQPVALRRTALLDGRTGAGFDPCAVFSLPITLAPEESTDLFFLLGEAKTTSIARTLLERYQDRDAIEAAFEATTSFWTNTLSRIQVETPAPEMDVLLNGWLLYQDLACRIWARSAFYQSGGAYGFRDQLQDVMALVYTRPDITREQILRHAAHQFVEGDVLHWWHPPTGRGIRSRFSDDLLWLPLVTAFYIHSTGDTALLDETEPYLTARQLEEDEDEAYLVPTRSNEQGGLYDHCCRALDRSLTKGPHGLPLMGSGDWNDGMNRVGHKGRGESVWLGFFLYRILSDFLPFCEQRGDEKRVANYRAYMEHLKTMLNDTGWDGDWYRRAYYDDGAPLGSKESDEAKIDAIAQAWSVISGVAPPERAQQALDAVEEHLIDEDAGLIKLLTPPFDKTPHDPGYIKGYIPGVRENGGQYTHAALWVIDAFALSGQGTRASELYALINPINHANTPEEVQQYKVEPYVVTADIYGVPPHVGRGGWSWYTGSAGWMYRIGLESILGLHLVDGNALRLNPCIPAHWPGFTLQYRLDDEQTVYIIHVENPDHVEQGVTCVKVDGDSLSVVDGMAHIPLEKTGDTHDVQIMLG